MSLYIDLSLGFGYHKQVFDTLLQIVRCDPGLSTTQPNLEVLEVTYSQKHAGTTTSNRILSLVEAPQNILIIGVDTGFIFPGTAATTITTFCGGVTEPGALTKPIMIWLDVTEAAGQYYNVHDKDGKRIHSAAPVCLYHELAHAYHLSIGDYTPGPPGEVQATTDENVFRSYMGLPQRHPSDHYGAVGVPEYGGVVFPTCEPENTSTWSLGRCIVATAATGSGQSPAVTELRRARDEYRGMSDWASQIAEPVIAQYWRFAPGVVREMESDEELREAVLAFAVQPVVGLLEMVEAELDPAAESDGLLAGMDAVLAEYAAGASAAGYDAAALLAAADAAATAGRRLGGEADTGAGAPPVGSGDAERAGERHAPENLFGYLAAEIAASGRDTSGFAWGFEGLSLFLRRAAAKLGDGDEIDAGAVAAIAGWLGRLPMPSGDDLDPADAPQELRVLGERLLTHPEARAVFAARLLDRSPGSSAASLESALAETGYVTPDRPGES